MKNLSVIILLSVIISLPVFSQSKAGDKMGIGIGIDPSRVGQLTIYSNGPGPGYSGSFINSYPISIYLPINLNAYYRFEPYFGLYSSSDESTTTSASYLPQTNTEDVSNIAAGIRFFYVSSLSKSLNLYSGPKVEFNFLYSSTGYTYYNGNTPQAIKVTNITEMHQTNLILGLVFGAEYFPVSHFSVGGEASFNYTSFGNPEITYTPAQSYSSSTETKQHSFHTDVLILVRWYFL